MAKESVTATDAALHAIAQLQAEHGPLSFFQSAGCCDGSVPICLKRGELPPGPGDKLLGAPGGAPFYIDAELHRRWGNPALLVDLGAGPADGFSISPAGTHFITRPAPPR